MVSTASQVVSVVKNLPANTGDVKRSNPGLDPWVEKIPGGGHGNPLQYSCLENPMDRGAWRDTVHGVTKSRTWLKQLNTHDLYPSDNINMPCPDVAIKNVSKDCQTLIAALFVIAKYQTQLSCLLLRAQINKLWFIFATKFYSTARSKIEMLYLSTDLFISVNASFFF